MDLLSLSLTELRAFSALLPKEIERREKEEKANLIHELDKIAREKGFNLNDLLVQQEKIKTTVAIKYRHPSDSSFAWTGRGRQPKWVVAFIQEGGSLEQLKVE